MSYNDRDEARRAYNRTAFWFCLVCALLIGGGLLWAKANEEPAFDPFPAVNPCAPDPEFPKPAACP